MIKQRSRRAPQAPQEHKAPTLAVQHYVTDDGTEVVFQDWGQNRHASKCQPRDIVVLGDVDNAQRKHLQEAICIDIRLGQGYPEVGVAKGMLW